MKPSLACAAIISFFTVSAAAADDGMTLDFSFKGTRGCITLYANPEIRIRNVPPGATRVLLRLIGPNGRDLGGQETALLSSGIISAGSIRTFAPCDPGLYMYQAIVKADDGRTIAVGEMERLFGRE